MFKFLQLKGLWQRPDFIKLWLGQTVSLFGSAVTNLALPLTAALTLQATPVQMGLLKAAQFAPFLLIGLMAGVWVDRRRRRPILIVTDLGRALLLGSIRSSPRTAAYRTPLLGSIWIGYSQRVFKYSLLSLRAYFDQA